MAFLSIQMHINKWAIDQYITSVKIMCRFLKVHDHMNWKFNNTVSIYNCLR